MDRELLNTYSDGLIATTGRPSGEVQTRLRLGQYEEALAATDECQDICVKEFYYYDLMDHDLEIETRVRDDLLRLAKAINAPLVATNDLHYTRQEDYKNHEALLALQSGSTLLEPTYDEGGKRFAFSGSSYYVKSAAEMHELFRDLPEALSNTLRIAEQCEVEFRTVDEGANFMPHFPVPEGQDETSWFISEVERGLHNRYPHGIPDDVRKQANYETDVIVQMGFPGYFLVVADLIVWDRDQDIRVGPGRGSAAGSIGAYAVVIIVLEPM